MKKFVRIMSVVLCVVLCAAVFAACGKKKSDKLVLGFSGPLTGGAAIYGEAVKNGAQMAVDEINEKGGINGVQIELVAMNDEHDASKVPTVYASLIEKGMQVSLGTVTTKPALQFKTLAKDDNVFFLTPSASGDAVPEFDNGYQMCFADSNQGTVAAKVVKETYADKKVGIFYKSDDPYSIGIYNMFVASLGTVAHVDASFTDSTSADFSSQIETLKDCNFIFMPIYADAASLFMKTAKGTIADNAVYYGCDGLDGIDSVKGFDITTIPQKVSMLSHFDSTATTGKAGEFSKKYVEKYGKGTLNQFGASAYDCVYAISEALKKADIKDLANASASDICEALKAQFNGGFTFSGVTGENITWNANGFVKKDAVEYVVKEAN